MGVARFAHGLLERVGVLQPGQRLRLAMLADDQERRRAEHLDATGDRSEGGDFIGAGDVHSKPVVALGEMLDGTAIGDVVGSLVAPEEQRDDATLSELIFDEVLACE